MKVEHGNKNRDMSGAKKYQSIPVASSPIPAQKAKPCCVPGQMPAKSHYDKKPGKM